MFTSRSSLTRCTVIDQCGLSDGQTRAVRALLVACACKTGLTIKPAKNIHRTVMHVAMMMNSFGSASSWSLEGTTGRTMGSYKVIDSLERQPKHAIIGKAFGN